MSTIHGTFEGLDTGGTNTLVDLLKNNIPVASGNVIGFGPISDVPLSFGPVLLVAGDTLAFAVGATPVNPSTPLPPPPPPHPTPHPHPRPAAPNAPCALPSVVAKPIVSPGTFNH